ncbi:MAG: hypothetical protein GY715_01050 [Planctomycetes bacterium]|nr:hypothetical protein [Planctomycetota bacterium]
MKRCTLSFAAIAAAAAVTTSAPAGSHFWEVVEAFSNADGTIQFVEMKESMGAAKETGLFNKWLKSIATGNQYTITENLVAPTSNKSLLFGTAGFAALPGAPTPDYIIVDGFFNVTQDTLEYWLYNGPEMQIAFLALPTDGVTSLDRDGTTAVNSPRNYAEEEGTVIAACVPQDLNNNGSADFGDILAVIAAWGQTGLNPHDLSGNGIVDFADILQVVGNWGPC